MLIPQWHAWWRLYSTWFFVGLGLLGSVGDFITQFLDYLDLPIWIKFFIYMGAAVCGIYSRLKLQPKVRSDGPTPEQQPEKLP